MFSFGKMKSSITTPQFTTHSHMHTYIHIYISTLEIALRYTSSPSPPQPGVTVVSRNFSRGLRDRNASHAKVFCFGVVPYNFFASCVQISTPCTHTTHPLRTFYPTINYQLIILFKNSLIGAIKMSTNNMFQHAKCFWCMFAFRRIINSMNQF